MCRYGGYAGELSAKQVSELLADENAEILLLDIRPDPVRENDGLPDLRLGARYKAVSLPLSVGKAYLPSSRLTGTVRGIRDLDKLALETYAVVVAGLKQVRCRDLAAFDVCCRCEGALVAIVCLFVHGVTYVTTCDTLHNPNLSYLTYLPACTCSLTHFIQLCHCTTQCSLPVYGRIVLKCRRIKTLHVCAFEHVQVPSPLTKVVVMDSKDSDLSRTVARALRKEGLYNSFVMKVSAAMNCIWYHPTSKLPL